MHEAGGTGRTDARDRLGPRHLDDLRADGSGEHAVVPVLVQRAPVTPGHDLEWSVVERHLVEEVEDGEHVVVRVQLEQDVLVELDLGGGTGLLRVDLRVAEFEVGTDEFRRGVDGCARTHDGQVGIRQFGR